jgi:hypothetical protein
MNIMSLETTPRLLSLHITIPTIPTMADFHQISDVQHTHTQKMCEIMNERDCPKGSEGNGQAVLYTYAKSHLEGQGEGEITIDEIAAFINDEYGFYEPPISYDEGQFVVNDSPRVFSDSEITTMKINTLKAELIKWTTRTHVGKKAELAAKLRSICAGKSGQQRSSIHPYEMGGETIRKKRISLIGARLKSNVAKYPPLWINSRGIHPSVVPVASVPVVPVASVPVVPVATPEPYYIDLTEDDPPTHEPAPSMPPGINNLFKKRPADTFNRRSPSSGLRNSVVCDNKMGAYRPCVQCARAFFCPTTYKGKNFRCLSCKNR